MRRSLKGEQSVWWGACKLDNKPSFDVVKMLHEIKIIKIIILI